MTIDINKSIIKLRQLIEDSYVFNAGSVSSLFFKYIDEFINDKGKSNLEKAFFLILNLYPDEKKNYIVIPNEKVLIPDIYETNVPAYEYEIDFALYGGSIDNPVKVAIECDGIRSHGQKYKNRDRRKDVNLQACGWIVMRFNSKEIHTELHNFEEIEYYTSNFLYAIENTIKSKINLITDDNYVIKEVRSSLTGYKWGDVICKNCGFKQDAILNHEKITCIKCSEKFVRDINPSERINYKHNGIIYFK